MRARGTFIVTGSFRIFGALGTTGKFSQGLERCAMKTDSQVVLFCRRDDPHKRDL
jgi:hypothetical protein